MYRSTLTAARLKVVAIRDCIHIKFSILYKGCVVFVQTPSDVTVMYSGLMINPTTKSAVLREARKKLDKVCKERVLEIETRTTALPKKANIPEKE